MWKIDPEKQELIRTYSLVAIAASLIVIAYNINAHLIDVVQMLGALVNKGN
ncbi:hypothetical protein ACIQW7_24325 [Peribacillus simplex]|uniref:hypothetical protein n=1 Tax=Peribacillus TaxID=2675229 RepID=UPI0029557F9C|nr:hypothetical protein [Peribacillus sp. CSMR9]MDV7767765.1 hypothetical protein [Peribacillus sp. CSMR9]